MLNVVQGEDHVDHQPTQHQVVELLGHVFRTWVRQEMVQFLICFVDQGVEGHGVGGAHFGGGEAGGRCREAEHAEEAGGVLAD